MYMTHFTSISMFACLHTQLFHSWSSPFILKISLPISIIIFYLTVLLINTLAISYRRKHEIIKLCLWFFSLNIMIQSPSIFWDIIVVQACNLRSGEAKSRTLPQVQCQHELQWTQIQPEEHRDPAWTPPPEKKKCTRFPKMKSNQSIFIEKQYSIEFNAYIFIIHSI